MLYFVKTPKIIKRLFPKLSWEVATNDKVVYLTFDDGPTLEITLWVTAELKKYNAKATFFCVGKNIVNHPEIITKIINEGHSIGNHTHNHLNCWKSQKKRYLENIDEAQETINRFEPRTPLLFRPPYGKINEDITKKLLKKGYKIIMWDVLSGDFDKLISKKKCLNNILNNTTSGSIVVFHDSVKASKNLKYCLPKVLERLNSEGYTFKAL